jgi:hypothetical protein
MTPSLKLPLAVALALVLLFLQEMFRISSKEQRIGVSQAGNSVTLMDQATQQHAALVEKMASAASGLHQQARKLVALVPVFGTGPEPFKQVTRDLDCYTNRGTHEA